MEQYWRKFFSNIFLILCIYLFFHTEQMFFFVQWKKGNVVSWTKISWTFIGSRSVCRVWEKLSGNRDFVSLLFWRWRERAADNVITVLPQDSDSHLSGGSSDYISDKVSFRLCPISVYNSLRQYILRICFSNCISLFCQRKIFISPYIFSPMYKMIVKFITPRL